MGLTENLLVLMQQERHLFQPAGNLAICHSHPNDLGVASHYPHVSKNKGGLGSS